jgi:ankyrin repeat protein
MRSNVTVLLLLLLLLCHLQDSKGRTPLLTACHHGHWDCAEQLLEAASNIFACDKDGNGVLHLTAIHGHAALLQQLLVKAEAQAVTARLAGTVNLSGFTPLHYAAFAGMFDIASSFKPLKLEPDPLGDVGSITITTVWLYRYAQLCHVLSFGQMG